MTVGEHVLPNEVHVLVGFMYQASVITTLLFISIFEEAIIDSFELLQGMTIVFFLFVVEYHQRSHFNVIGQLIDPPPLFIRASALVIISFTVEEQRDPTHKSEVEAPA